MVDKISKKYIIKLKWKLNVYSSLILGTSNAG